MRRAATFILLVFACHQLRALPEHSVSPSRQFVIYGAAATLRGAISAFQGGGAGAGDIQDIMAMDIRMATTGTAMAIRTDTAAMVTEVMDTVTTATVTAMDMGTVLAAKTVAANTALRLGRG